MDLSDFDEAERRVQEEIRRISLEAGRNLRQLWLQTFDVETCVMNVSKLPEHVTLFYEEIIQETKDRQDLILKGIKDLHEEASTLRRLLKVDVTLSPKKGEPLLTFQYQLNEQLKDLREQLKMRKEQIMELLLQQEALCEELNEMPRPLLDDPLPTEDEIGDFKLHLDQLRAEKNNRLYLVHSYRKEIKGFMEELEMPIRSDEEEYLLNDRSIRLSKANVERLKNLREEYINQMEETRKSIEDMKKKLEKIWECINESPKTRNKFANYTDYSQTTYDIFYKELNRCEAIKRQNIKLFVDKCREELVEWWNKTKKSDAERSRFTHFTNDWYTEDLLALHEIELEEIKRFYEENEEIYNLYNERKILWDRMQALETKSHEPGRYNNRGGQLLKEEKERKTISTKLPKIEDKLKELVLQYEIKNNRKFTIYGDDILMLIELEWEEKRAKKEKCASARKNCGVGGTPNRTAIQSRTPMSLRNPSALGAGGGLSSAKKFTSTASLFNGSSVPLTNKRKLKEPTYPSSKRNLCTELEAAVKKTPFKSPLKKIKVIGSTIKRRSARLSNGKKKRNSKGANKSGRSNPKIKLNNETVYSSSENTGYDIFEEYIHKEPASRSSIVQSSVNETLSSTVSTRRHKTNRNIENTSVGKDRAQKMLKMMHRTPSKLHLNEQVSVVTKKDILSRSRTNSPMPQQGNIMSRKLTTKNLPIII